jgi:hypothetical protein
MSIKVVECEDADKIHVELEKQISTSHSCTKTQFQLTWFSGKEMTKMLSKNVKQSRYTPWKRLGGEEI